MKNFTRYKDADLPNTLGELLAAALIDARKVEAAPNIELNMDVWFENWTGTPCSVCLAGAVMLEMEPEIAGGRFATTTPENWPEDTKNKLQALDSLRALNLKHALWKLHGPDMRVGLENRAQVVADQVRHEYGHMSDIEPSGGHEHDGERWWGAMEMLRDGLLKEGI